jgi:hypothetical protein
MSNKKINEDKILKKINTEQLQNSANNIDMTIEKQDCNLTEFVEHPNAPHYDERDMDFSINSFPEFAPYPETNRFSKKIPIDGKKIQAE